MKKKVVLLIVLVVVLLLIVKKCNVKETKYKIKSNDTTFTVIEKYNKEYYYFEIINQKVVYPINVFDLKKGKKQINRIYSYNDDTYSCILPLFNNTVLTDIMCYKDDILYNYRLIIGKDEKLDNYVKTIKEYKVRIEDTETKYNNIISFYNNIKNVSITTYKGILINKSEVKLFDKDVYSNRINTYVDKYYITADYNSNYEFNKFYVVNLETKEVSNIKTKNPISFDSYIQGIVDNKVYLYDPENEVQYEIDPKNKNISITSGEYMKYYSNNTWSKISVKATKKELYFDYSSKYTFENDYYYYLLENSNLYRINRNNTSVKSYILNIPVDDIYTNNDYIYYKDGESIYYYSDLTGLKLILTNTELEFNKDIKYYIY